MRRASVLMLPALYSALRMLEVCKGFSGYAISNFALG
jgi:hypothetical protein